MRKFLASIVFLLGLLLYSGAHSPQMETTMSESSEEKIVKAQLDAFNKKDVEGCLQYFSEDLKVTVLPDEKVIASSKGEIRSHVIKQIESGDFMTATLTDIRSNGPYVTTTEVKEGGGTKTTITFIYYVKDDLIRKMWGAPYSQD